MVDLSLLSVQCDILPVSRFGLIEVRIAAGHAQMVFLLGKGSIGREVGGFEFLERLMVSDGQFMPLAWVA